MARDTRSFPALLCLLAAALFGASTPVSKALLSSMGPLTLAGLLYLGGALAVLPASFRGGSAELRRNPRQRGMLALAVVLGGWLGPVFLLLGLRAAPAASVSLWLNMETVATTILAWALFREHLDRRTVLAVLSVLVGGLLLAAPAGAAGWVSAGLVALACLCWGFDNNLTALISGYTPAQVTLVKGVGAGTINLALGLVLEQQRPDAPILFTSLGVGALAYGISIMLYIMGARQLGASRSQLLFSTSPFLGVVLAWTLFHEDIHPAQLTAAAFMALGIYLILTARHEHEHTHEPMTHTHAHRHDDGHHTHTHPGLPAWIRHTHPHEHEAITHTHPHMPDLHHRHGHGGVQGPSGRAAEPPGDSSVG
jgi:drug/metabolite transporter (DMT)-like permease